ncbi:zinc finger protein DZIP1L isoform X1 [Anguilla anguilla]|uniref:zinc finger protein DZIP1L isoform X1 n=2 Tax=Anguilla anguilla TaxID=7936 RepID=UPI0015AE6D61|nr:zinc finger protein DZIP1L isoform X1 [Anguilla anguilla]
MNCFQPFHRNHLYSSTVFLPKHRAMPGQQLSSEVFSALTAAPPWSPGPLQPLRFRTRREPVDWRRLGALDVDRVAREMDVAVLQEHINAVTFCDVEAERCPHCRGPVDPALLKVLRMSQLSTEYLLHCQDYLSAQLTGLEERLQGALSQLEQEGKERARLDAELQAVRQESRRRKKMIATQQLLLQAGASNYHKCHCCEKSFINYSYLQAHLQRRHPEVTDAERQKRRQVEQMEDGIEELRERLRLTQSKLEAEREAEALRKQQELEQQQKKEASERQELESWKEEERRKFQQEIGDLKQLLLQEFKDISNQGSSIEAKLQELQARPVAVSNLGTLRDEEEQDDREARERELRRESELRGERELRRDNELMGKIAQQKSKWKRRLHDIHSGHLLEKQELQNENERLRMALSSDQKTALQSLQQQISSLAAQMKRKDKIIQSQEEKIKKLSTRPVAASPVIPDEESSELEEQEDLGDSGDRTQKSSLSRSFRPILEGKLEDRLESMGLRKGTKGISKQTFRSLSSLVTGQRQQKARQFSDLLGLRETLTQEVTHRVRRQWRSQGSPLPTVSTNRRTPVSPKQQKSPKARSPTVKAPAKQVQSQAPQPAPRSTVPLQAPRTRPQRNSTPPFSSEEDSTRDAAPISSPRSKSMPSVRVVQSGVKQNLAADAGDDWSDSEPSEGPVSNRTPKSQGSVVQSLTRSLERQLSSPRTKPVGGTRVMPPATASSHRPRPVVQLSDEDSDLDLSSIEDISPQAAVGRAPRTRGSADSAGSPGTSVWSSSASRGGGW